MYVIATNLPRKRSSSKKISFPEKTRERERERGREREGVRDTPNEKPSVGNELFRRRVATTAKGNALLTRN